MAFRLHFIGLPHTATNHEYNGCAYTAKVWKAAKAFTERGHTVYHYGTQGSNPPCTENVSILSEAEQTRFFGPHDKTKAYDVDWDTNKPHWQKFNGNAIKEIKARSQPGDILCCITGSHKPIAEALRDLHAVEYGIGYFGTFRQYPPCDLPVRRCFESAAHMNMVHSKEGFDPDGSPYDVVIPNYFDVDDFPFSAQKKDYFLYVGRLTRRKGIQIAVETTRKIGAKLVIAGQGAIDWRPGQLTTREETYRGDHLEFVGPVSIEQRGKLMSEARALFVPTQYHGPFEGVHIEANLCGTPVITTDHGVFPETVEQDKTGCRCRIMEQFIQATKIVDYLDYAYIRERAARLYSLETVARQFEDYFATFAA